MPVIILNTLLLYLFPILWVSASINMGTKKGNTNHLVIKISKTPNKTPIGNATNKPKHLAHIAIL